MREKIIAVIVIVLSTMALGTVMLLGKILGKDVSEQQEYIQKHFRYTTIENDSQAEMELGNFSPDQLASVSNQGTILGIVVIVSFILILSAAVLVEKNIPQQNQLPNLSDFG